MLNRHFTPSGRFIPRMAAALALAGVGVAWLLRRARPGRTRPLQGHPAVTQEAPNPVEPLWASVAGEEDPGAAVDPPAPSATPPHDDRK
jgi:hypothetical protein